MVVTVYTVYEQGLYEQQDSPWDILRHFYYVISTCNFLRSVIHDCALRHVCDLLYGKWFFNVFGIELRQCLV